MYFNNNTNTLFHLSINYVFPTIKMINFEIFNVNISKLLKKRRKIIYVPSLNFNDVVPSER